MRLVVMQPSYLPWLGYFDLLIQADLFLFYDTVQYDKDGWRNRNRIKTANGPQWLTVPVLTSGLNKPLIKDIKINNREPWQRKHLKSLQMNYAKTKFYDETYPEVESILSRDWERLMELNEAVIRKLCGMLEIRTSIQRVSELGLDFDEGKNEKLIQICKHVGADEFYEAAGGKGYIEESLFKENGIHLRFQDYKHPVYPQLYGDFVSSLSVVDLLCNCGREDSIRILKEASALSQPFSA